MGELGDGVEAEGRQAVAHQVFEGLDGVLGDGFLLGEPVDLGLTEVAVQGAQALLVGIRQGARLEERAVGERDQPFDLDLDAGAVQTRLREEVGEAGDGAAVATVEGAQGLRRERRLESQGSPPDRAPGVRGVRGWRRAGSSWRNSPRVAVSIIPSTESNISGPA